MSGRVDCVSWKSLGLFLQPHGSLWRCSAQEQGLEVETAFLLCFYGSVSYLEHDGKTQCSSGMRYRNIEFLVSILYYSPAVVQPRKPFVQEISRKKDRTVFQCPPYIFPYILSPYVMHVLYLLYGGLQYLYMVPAQIYSMHVMLYHARSEY